MRLIDGDALFDVLYHMWGTEMDTGPAGLFMDMINNAPTITHESLVRHGKWIRMNNTLYSPFDGSSPYIYFCSRCNAEEKSARKFCPECGCKMDLEAEE